MVLYVALPTLCNEGFKSEGSSERLMDSALEIARKATMRPIEEVAEQLGLARSDLVLHGPHIAKINWEAIQKKKKSDSGFLVLVTSISPTAFG